MSKVTKALMGSAITLAGMAGVSQSTVENIVEANNAVSQNKVAQSGTQQLYNRLPSVDYVYSNCGMSPKEYGLYLLRSGKNKYNDRKRKHYAKAWA